ncbi:helix-turn-helix transcriptional regulator [Gordonia sp. PKS22-38]|uniref:Helix-turn-helix transcriptional regulator n=1 Tax=Gordonia prachuapensis TaxID=3115651 RepID=A0ABU7MTK1_9ACTN|nr:helix-turn-helix transcriptional regulator [Gordonia sp. PKS22-38]
MEITKDIRDFLMARRAEITPDQVGLPSGGRRRVPGLRREEVALLAGVSTEYYTQIERGHVEGVSDEVLGAIVSTLRLNDEEVAHLFDLVRAATARRSAKKSTSRSGAKVPGGVQALMDAMVTAPAIVINGRLDIIGTNALGRAVYEPLFARSGSVVPNIARFTFLDPQADKVFPDWRRSADDAVALLRVEGARSPHSAAVTGLVGELATRSDEFRCRWAAQHVAAHRRGTKRFINTDVGELTLQYEALELASAPGLVMIGYTPEPGSKSEESLRLLSSLAAPVHDEQAESPAAPVSSDEHQ